MSDPRPLRQEDQLALQEENRRLTAEVAALKSKESPDDAIDAIKRKLRALSDKLKGFAASTPAMLVVVGLATVATVAGVRKFHAWVSQPDPVCYDVAKMGGSMPWDPWYVWWNRDCRSVCAGLDQGIVEKDHAKAAFPSREAALEFIDRWQLPRCK